MKKIEKRYFTLLSLLLIIVLTLASCAVDETDKKPDSGEQAVVEDFIMESGSQVYIVLDKDRSLPSDLYDAIWYATEKDPILVDGSAPAGAHEIVIGKVENREVSQKAYRELSNMELQDKGALYAGYAIYSDGNSIGIAFDYDVALDVAFDALLNEILVPDSGGRVKMDAGTDVSDYFDLNEKYNELSNKIRNDEYEALKNRIDTLGYDGDAIVAAVKKLYSLYSPDAYVWLANLYDPDIGGFYYSVSARDTVGFLPDIESTNQALNFIINTGMQSNLNANLPKEISKQIVSFVQGLQSSEDGYFYHPQWVEFVTTDNRRGRDLTWAENTLGMFGANPLYDTPNGTKGTLGAPGQNSGAALTASLATPVSALVSKVSKVTPAAADYLESDAAFLEYLNSFDWASGSYEPGNTIAAQAKQIKAKGRMDVCINFLNNLQNPETGMFESFPPGYSDEAVNGFLKVSAVYIEGGYAIPNAENAAKTCIDTLTSDTPAGTVCWVYNVWFALDNIINSLNGDKASGDDKALAASIRDELLTNAAEYIEVGAEKYAPFRKEDGSFSFTPDATSAFSQGMPVAIQGMNEGDVNATNISIAGIAGYLFNALGLRDYQPSIYTKYDWYQFEELLSSMGTIIKTRFNMYNAADFETAELKDIFGSSSHVEFDTEPEALEDEKYSYAYITDNNNSNVLHYGKLNEGYESYLGKVATGFSGKKYTLQLKMKYLGGTASTNDPWNARLAMYNDGARFWTVCFYPLADGRLAVGSKSAPVAILEQNTWYTLTFEYFAEENVCHFYANGTHIGKAGTVDTSKNDNGYARALLELKNQSTASFYFDDILVKKEKEDYVEPPLEIGDAKGDFYKNAENKGTRKDYDAMFATVPNLASGSAFSSLNIVDGDLEFKKLNSDGESSIQYDVPANSTFTTPILIFESDIKFSGITAASFGKIRLYSKDKEITFTTTLQDGIVTIGPVSGKNSLGKKLEMPVEQWHNVRFEVDYTSCEIHVFLDNAHVTTYTNVAFTNASGSRKILLYLYKAETQGAVLMDNIFYGLVEDGSFETVIPDGSDEPVTPEIVLPPAVSGTENNGKGDYYSGTVAGISGATKDYASGTAPKLEVPSSRVASAVAEIADGVLKFYKINTDNEEYFKQSYTTPSTTLTNGVAIWEADLSFGNATEGKLGRFTICVNGLEVVIGLHVGNDGKLYFGTEHNAWADSPALDAGKWYNVRFEYYYHETTKSGATGVIKVYLNNQFACTMTGVGVNSRSWTDIRNLMYLAGPQKSAYLFVDNLYLGFADMQRTPDPEVNPDNPGDGDDATANNGKGAYYSGALTGTNLIKNDFTSGSAPALQLWPTDRTPNAVAEITDGMLKFYKTATDYEEYFLYSGDIPADLVKGVAIWEADVSFGDAATGVIGRMTICANGLELVVGIHAGEDGKIYLGAEKAAAENSPAFEAGKWYNIRLEYAYHEAAAGNTNTVDLYVNNEFTCTMTGIGVTARSWTNARNLYYLAKEQEKAYFYIDNYYFGFIDENVAVEPEDPSDATTNNGKGAYYTGALTGTNLIKNDFTSGTAPALQLWPTDRTPNAVAEITDGMLKFYKTATDYEEYFLYSGDIPADLVKGVAIWEADVSFGDAATGVIGRMTICANGLELVVGIHAGEDGKIYLGAEKAAAENSPAFEAGKWYNIRLEYAYHEAAAGNTNTVDLYVNNEFTCTMTGIGVTARSWTNARNLYYLAKEQEKAYFYIDNYYFGFIDENVAVEPEEPEAPVTNKGTGVYYNDKSVDGDRYSYDEADAVAPTIGDGASHCTSELSDGVAVFKKITNDGESYLKFSKGGQNWDADNYCTVIEFDYKLDTETAITTYYHHRFRLDSSDYLDLYLNSDTETYSIGAKDTAAIEVGKWHNVRFEIYFIEDSINGNREYAKVYIDNEYATTKQLATASGYNGRLLVYLAKQIVVDTTVVNIDNMFFGHMDKAYVEETTN